MTTTPPRHPARQHQKFLFPYGYPGAGFAASVSATGTIVCATNAAAADGDIVTIGDGINPPKVYEYDKSANGVTATRISWAVGTTAASNATALKLLINANQPIFTITDDLAGTLTLVNTVPGTSGNVAITSTGTVIASKTGMAGGLASVATSVTTDTFIKLHKARGRSVRIDRVSLNIPAGLVGYANNFCNFKLMKGASTVMASWSTLTTAQSTIAADTNVELAITTTTANRYLADGDVMSLFIDVTGSVTVPPGRIVVEGSEL